MNKHYKHIALFSLLFSLAPFLYLCFFIHPSADDFAFPVLLREGVFGFQDYVSYMHQNWNGRYGSNIIGMFNPLVLDSILLYKAAAFLQFPALLGAIYLLLKETLVEKLHFFPLFIISLWILVLYLNVIPGLSETIYWMSGSMVYTWGLVFLITGIAFLLRIHDHKRKLFSLTVGSFIFFFAIGFNELSLFAGLVFGILYLFLIKDYGRYIPLVLALIAGIIMVAAPGNAIRTSHFSLSGDVFEALRISTFSYAKLQGIHWQSPSLLLGLLVAFLAGAGGYLRLLVFPFFQRNPLWTLLAFHLFLWAMMFIPAYATAINPPLRIYNFASLFWIIMHLYLALTVGQLYYHRFLKYLSAMQSLLIFVVFMVSMLFMWTDFHKKPGGEFVFRSNSPGVWYDALSSVKSYNRHLTQRYQYLDKNKGSAQTLKFPGYPNPPQSIHFIDITPNSSHWINQLYASYFEVEAVVLEE